MLYMINILLGSQFHQESVKEINLFKIKISKIRSQLLLKSGLLHSKNSQKVDVRQRGLKLKIFRKKQRHHNIDHHRKRSFMRVL